MKIKRPWNQSFIRIWDRLIRCLFSIKLFSVALLNVLPASPWERLVSCLWVDGWVRVYVFSELWNLKTKSVQPCIIWIMHVLTNNIVLYHIHFSLHHHFYTSICCMFLWMCAHTCILFCMCVVRHLFLKQIFDNWENQW